MPVAGQVTWGGETVAVRQAHLLMPPVPARDPNASAAAQTSIQSMPKLIMIRRRLMTTREFRAQFACMHRKLPKLRAQGDPVPGFGPAPGFDLMCTARRLRVPLTPLLEFELFKECSRVQRLINTCVLRSQRSEDTFQGLSFERRLCTDWRAASCCQASKHKLENKFLKKRAKKKRAKKEKKGKKEVKYNKREEKL
jgi:hypothetical protein